MSQDDDKFLAAAAAAIAEEMDLDADDYYARKLARAALSAMPQRELRYMDEGEQAIMSAALRKSAKVVSRNEPGRELLAEALEALTKTPLIEALTPTSEEWRTCETVQDTYDLMKHRIRAAADKIRAALTQEKQT